MNILDLKHIALKYNQIFKRSFIEKTVDLNTNVISSSNTQSFELSCMKTMDDYNRSCHKPFVYSIESFGRYMYICYYDDEISKSVYKNTYFKRVPKDNFYIEKYDDSYILVFVYDKILTRKEYAHVRRNELDPYDFRYTTFRKYWDNNTNVKYLLLKVNIIKDVDWIVGQANKNKNKNALIELDKPTDINGWKIIFHVIRSACIQGHDKGSSKWIKERYFLDTIL